MPAMLGRYEIVERLAAGGMGEVFIGRFVGPGGFVKPVAVKRIHPHLASDETFIQMLLDEARVASAIQHPNIVATLDVGCEDGQHYVAIQYVSGNPLSRLIREMKGRGDTLPPWLVAWIGAGVASALHAAHEARSLEGSPLGIVHRDVSPANVILSDAGHPMLLDFGVAKAAQKMHQTEHGQLKGKLPYMAPEVFHGAEVDRTIDVYSLGVMLYESLTGVSPFSRSNDVETIMALQQGTVGAPGTLASGIDERLESVVLTAMAHDRAARFRGADEVERELRQWARSVGASHDAAAAAAWIAEVVPTRLHARRELLARVGSSSSTPRVVVAPARELASSEADAETATEAGPTIPGVTRAMVRERPPRGASRATGALAALAAAAATSVLVVGAVWAMRQSASPVPAPTLGVAATSSATEDPVVSAAPSAPDPPVAAAPAPSAAPLVVTAAPARRTGSLPPRRTTVPPPSAAPIPTPAPTTPRGPLLRSYDQ